jgi:hypothetical protein
MVAERKVLEVLRSLSRRANLFENLINAGIGAEIAPD